MGPLVWKVLGTGSAVLAASVAEKIVSKGWAIASPQGRRLLRQVGRAPARGDEEGRPGERLTGRARGMTGHTAYPIAYAAHRPVRGQPWSRIRDSASRMSGATGPKACCPSSTMVRPPTTTVRTSQALAV